METTQFIKDNQGKNIFAVVSLEEYNNLQYEKANLKETNIPHWHKEVLDEDLKRLEQDLAVDSFSNELTWEELKKEIKMKYGY